MRFTTKLTTLFTVIVLSVSVVLSYFVYTSNIKILEKEITDRLEDQALLTNKASEKDKRGTRLINTG